MERMLGNIFEKQTYEVDCAKVLIALGFGKQKTQITTYFQYFIAEFLTLKVTECQKPNLSSTYTSCFGRFCTSTINLKYY